jgi:hypothetical protein
VLALSARSGRPFEPLAQVLARWINEGTSSKRPASLRLIQASSRGGAETTQGPQYSPRFTLPRAVLVMFLQLPLLPPQGGSRKHYRVRRNDQASSRKLSIANANLEGWNQEPDAERHAADGGKELAPPGLMISPAPASSRKLEPGGTTR